MTSNAKKEVPVTVIDAVMGKGKSTWMIEHVSTNHDEEFIIVVPTLSEVERYKSELEDSRPVYAPQSNSRNTKLESFKSSLRKGGSTIITTHALFSFWDEECFNLIQSKGYTLVLDETVDLIQEVYIDPDDYTLLIENGWICEEPHKKDSDITVLKATDKIGDYQGQFKAFIKHSQRNDLFKVQDNLYCWSIPPEKMLSFQKTWLLTYLFPCSETDNWFKFYGIKRNIMTLDDAHELIPHDGRYSGQEFADLLTILDDRRLNSIGDKSEKSGNPLSRSWYNSQRGKRCALPRLKNNLQNFFKHKCKGHYPPGRQEPNSFFNMWATYEAYRGRLAASPYASVNGGVKDETASHEEIAKGECFVAFNQRATNNFSHKSNLAYMVNPHPRVPVQRFFQKHDLSIDKDYYALSVLIQWVWRSRIRNGEPILLYLPSERLRKLLNRWLTLGIVIEQGCPCERAA